MPVVVAGLAAFVRRSFEDVLLNRLTGLLLLLLLLRLLLVRVSL